MVWATTTETRTERKTLTWARFDDHYFRHPKVIRAGRDARDLHMASIFYAAAELTDGFIPAGTLRMLAADADINDANRAAERLVTVGLWEHAADGWQIHDFLDYNRSAAQVKATREVRAQAGALGGVRSGESRRHTINEADDQANAKQNASVLPKQTRSKIEPQAQAHRSTASNHLSVNGTGPAALLACFAALAGRPASLAEGRDLAQLAAEGWAPELVEAALRSVWARGSPKVPIRSWAAYLKPTLTELKAQYAHDRIPRDIHGQPLRPFPLPAPPEPDTTGIRFPNAEPAAPPGRALR